MTNNKHISSTSQGRRYEVLLMVALLLVALGLLFFRSFLPGVVHFNNDTPLGFMKPLADNGLSDMFGRWNDRNTLGQRMMSPLPDVTNAILFGFGAVGFAKFYAPLALLVLGLCAWVFFRQLKLTPAACILGGLAAALNSDFLATACWGVASQPICFGMCYLALAAVVTTSRPAWLRLSLAGVAVGLGVMEAVDIGAIFSVAVAAFVLFHALVSESAPLAKRAVVGPLKVALVALVAGWVAYGTVSELVGTQIQGIAGMQDTPQAKAARWDWATQWSLPKREVLNLAVPGLFGFRMDSSQHGLKGGDYWGAGGRDPAWDRYFASGQQGQPPPGFIRYGGGGLYAGVLIVLVAVWTGIQALRKGASVFSPLNQKLIWFWLVAMGVALLLSVGRYAPFYWFLYQLPLVSFIRNPGKFIHILEWGLVVLFAYGVDGLVRSYIQPVASAGKASTPRLSGWWSRATAFDRKWTLGCLAAVGVCLVGWFIYAQSQESLISYLQTVQFDAESAKSIAEFSIEHVGWFVLRLIIAVGLVTLVVSGWFRGPRARWAGVLLGLFLAGDLALANRPWTIFWNYEQKYESNEVLDQLRQRPYEARVAILPSWVASAFQASPQLAQGEHFLDQVYDIEWKQQQFQYYNIQSLDIVQMPRMPADLDAFENSVEFLRNLRTQTPQQALPLVTRRWQLTSTRYILGAAPFLGVLNQALDPVEHRFRIRTRFDLMSKPETGQITAEVATNGNYAVFEFTGALPRAKLYTDWQVCARNPEIVKQFIPGLSADELAALKASGTNDFLTLKELAAPSFNPQHTVLVAESPSLPVPSTNAPAGSVEFAHYAAKDIVLHTKAAVPSVLLLNDRFDPGWKVTVDGKPESMLRCNYIMRGVQVPAGEHQVEFRFAPPMFSVYVTLTGLAAGLALLASLFFFRPAQPDSEPAVPQRQKAVS